MKQRRDQRGEMDMLLVPLIAVVVLFIAAGSFAIWAFSGRQDYKNNVDQKISTANDAVKKQTQLDDQKIYTEAAQKPYTKYLGPETYGSVSVTYPKTWSVYVNSVGTSGNGLDTYFNPSFVPPTTDQSSTYALRLKVVNQQYDSVIQQYKSNRNVTVSAYNLPNVKSVIGSRIEGQIQPKKQGSMVIIPIRDKTLEVWTESATYLNYFNTVILQNLSFIP